MVKNARKSLGIHYINYNKQMPLQDTKFQSLMKGEII